jgi:hypothetical protein
MQRRSRVPFAALALLVTLGACGVLGGDDDGVHETVAEPVDLDLDAPTYAAATRKGLLLSSGDAQRWLPGASEAEWLPGGRALVYIGDRVRIWDPAANELGPPVRLWREGEALVNPAPGDLKRSVTQVSVSHERLVEREGRAPVVGDVLTAYDLDLDVRWRADLPGPDPLDGVPARYLERTYFQGHTIDGITYLWWGDFNATGEESDPHYGLLRVGADGEVLDTVQVNQRIKSLWLSADGAALLATRRVSGHPCGGCQVTLELVELDPRTGDVVGEYGMPEAYDKSWNVTEVDKVADRVAIRFDEVVWPEGPDAEADASETQVLRGTYVLDDDGWTLLEGSKDEISWWQGPEDRIVARPVGKDDGFARGANLRLFWVHGDEERPLPGTLLGDVGRRTYVGSVPGQALPPE